MNYNGKQVLVTGATGFIGSALVSRLYKLGANVSVFQGDVRNRNDVDRQINVHTDYVFHFGSPSSQVLFKRQPRYAIETTLKGFMNIAQACERNGVRLVYPSTGLLSQGRSNEYARCKQITEDLATGMAGLDAIGLRIFATYGRGEGHKRDYASVPYLFARDMLAGRSPVIFGDGNQTRDFIYIRDTVEAIVRLAEMCPDPLVDVGSGEQISFNHILDELNVLIGEAPKPRYIKAPAGYVQETAADPKRLHDFYVPKVTFAEGLARTVSEIQKTQELNEAN